MRARERDSMRCTQSERKRTNARTHERTPNAERTHAERTNARTHERRKQRACVRAGKTAKSSKLRGMNEGIGAGQQGSDSHGGNVRRVFGDLLACSCVGLYET